MLIFLPILTAGLAPVHHDTNAALERELVAQIRADVKAGWTVVDGQAWDAGISVVKDGVVLRRSIVLEDDGEGGQLVATATPVTDKPAVDEFLSLAMVSGGVTLQMGCGDSFLTPYVIEDRARGEAAAKLVTETLRTADDLESALHSGGVITMTLERANQGLELEVELGADNRIDRATLKRVRVVTDEGTYKRKNRLRQALRGKTITTFDTSGMESEVVLVVGKKRFEIDPDGSAFESHPLDPDDSGCGC